MLSGISITDHGSRRLPRGSAPDPRPPHANNDVQPAKLAVDLETSTAACRAASTPCTWTNSTAGSTLPFFDSKSAEWRGEQDRLLRDVATHQAANQTYIEEGVQLLQSAHRAHELFERQEAGEKRRLLSFLPSNCVWKAGVLTAEYRQPFDMLALAREVGGGDEAMSGTKNGQSENWLPKGNADITQNGELSRKAQLGVLIS
jgi:hypothetical protein